MMPYFIREKKIMMSAQAPGARFDPPDGLVADDAYKGLSNNAVLQGSSLTEATSNAGSMTRDRRMDLAAAGNPFPSNSVFDNDPEL